MNWQPIETAPKDGTRILMDHMGQVVIARWSWFGSWEITENNHAYPSHWMPLPPMPDGA